LERGKDCPPEALIDAAHLAAHFSDARTEPVVDVQHTTKRYLRRPRGAAPGFVVVTKEKVIVLRVEPARLKLLLDGETSTDDLSAPPRE
jgi:predicted ribosome quality control (RQC) complex YloA/Tae2 family protein